MDDYNRMIALFGYEHEGGRKHLWNNPWDFSRQGGQAGMMLDESLAEWKAKKRALTEEEITRGEWSKIGDHGYSFKVQFLPGGKYIERDITRDESWEGAWKFVGIALRMNVGKYELDVIGNKEGNTHSGIEVADGKFNAYFTMIHEDKPKIEAGDTPRENDPLGIR